MVGSLGGTGWVLGTHLLNFPSDALISPSGTILIPGIREAVAPLSDEEWKMYQDIQFDMENYKDRIGVGQLMYNNKVRTSSGTRRGADSYLARRWTC